MKAMKVFWHRRQSIFIFLFIFGLFLAANGRPAAAGMLTMETSHFNIHFPDTPQAREIADKAAAIAEEIHPVLAKRIGHTPAKRTEIFLMDTSDFANGFADVTYYNRIGIYLAYPGLDTEWISGMTMSAEDWLRLVITHEYAHILQIDMNGGIIAEIRQSFGRVPYLATPNLLLTPAYVEGFAVREETLTSGGRGVDPYYDMFLRTAVLTDTVPTFDQMLGLYNLDKWQPAGTVYLYGWSLLDYIAREYGEEALRKVNEDHGSLKRLGLFWALSRSVGKPARVVWKEWRRDLEERYRAQAAELEAAGLTTPVEEITGPIMAASPVFSPDGTSLTYITLGKKDFYPGLYLRDLSSGKDRLLVAGDISSRPAWSPSGRQLVYAKPGYLDGDKLYNDLYLYDLNQQEERRLTRGLRATDPAWSPAGDYLVYVPGITWRRPYVCMIWPPVKAGSSGRRVRSICHPGLFPGRDGIDGRIWFPGDITGLHS